MVQYRRIKNLIQLGDLDQLKTIANLNPQPPGKLPLDPIYTAIEYSKGWMVPYFVEDRGLRSNIALVNALQHHDLDIAIYLHEEGFPLSEGNHIYSLDVMKLVRSWGYTFDDDAFSDIMCMWNAGDVLDRLIYLFKINPPAITLDWYTKCGINQDVANLLLDYTTPELFFALMDVAAEKGWIWVVRKLLTLNIPLNEEQLKTLAQNYDGDNFSHFLEELRIPREKIYSYIFHNSESFDDSIHKYLPTITNVREFADQYSLMDLAVKYGNIEAVKYLLDYSIPISEDNIRDLFSLIAGSGDNDFSDILEIIDRSPRRVREAVDDIIEEISYI